MNTNRLSEEELEQINGGKMLPADSGFAMSFEKCVHLFMVNSYVIFRSETTKGLVKGKILAQVYYNAPDDLIYPNYIIQNPVTGENEQISQDQIFIDVR